MRSCASFSFVWLFVCECWFSQWVNAFYSVDPKVSACMTCNSLWFMWCSNKNTRKKDEPTATVTKTMEHKSTSLFVCFQSFGRLFFRLFLPLFRSLCFSLCFCRCSFTGFRLSLIKWSFCLEWLECRYILSSYRFCVRPFAAWPLEHHRDTIASYSFNLYGRSLQFQFQFQFQPIIELKLLFN